MAKQQPPRPTRTDWQNAIPKISDDWYKADESQMSQEASQEEAGFVDKLWGSAKAVGEGLTFLPGGVVGTVQDAVFGFDPTDKAEMAQRAQREQELQAYQQKYTGQAFEGVTDAMTSIPYSAVTMGAGLAGGVAGGFAGPVGAGAAGMAASGTTAYRASVAEFERTMYGVTKEALGREPSPEEWTRVRDNFASEATKYGLWEAGPEAVSNLLMAKILGPLGSKFKGGVKDVIKSVAGLYGEELATETITQMGQGAVQADLGLRENAPGVVDAFKEVAPATFWQTTLMAGGKKGLDLAFKRASQGTQTEPVASGDAPFLPEDSEDLTDWLKETESKLDEEFGPEFGPEISEGQTVDLLDWAAAEVDAVSPYAALPEGTTPPQKMLPAAGLAGALALPQQIGESMFPVVSTSIPMQGTRTGLDPIAPPTDFSTPIPQPAAQSKLALPILPMSGMTPVMWAGGKSQLAYGPKNTPQGTPQGTQQGASAPIPAAQQILNVQPTPRADTTAQAQALGIPAPDPMPAASALGAGAPAVPSTPIAPIAPRAAQSAVPSAPSAPSAPSVPAMPVQAGTQQATSLEHQSMNQMLERLPKEMRLPAKKKGKAHVRELVKQHEAAPKERLAGTNSRGQRVFVDDRGVRSVEEMPGVRIEQNVELGSGGRSISVQSPEELFSAGETRFLTRDEIATFKEQDTPNGRSTPFDRHTPNGQDTPSTTPDHEQKKPKLISRSLVTGEENIIDPEETARKQAALDRAKEEEAQAHPEHNAQTPTAQATQEGYPKPAWGYGLPSFVTAQYGGSQKTEIEHDTATPAPEKSAKAPTSVDLSEHFARKLHEGRKYANIGQARRESMELTGKRLVPGTNDVKALDEAVELGVVRVSRTIIAEMRDKGASDVEIFRRLVELYQQQPNLGVRTSTSVAQQAYSTPVPLAFLASHLAGITDATTVYEPTAGNGMLIMEANPQKAVVNELNADRAARLRALGFTVTEKDAATYAPRKAVDVVIANPPFGRVRDDSGNPASWTVAGYETKELDHAIVLKALKALQPDGRAVLIVGGKQGSDETRASKYQAAMQRQFYRALFDNYKVVDHFTVDGKLYERQGAGYPVDFIVIDGKGRTEGRKFPAADLPRIYNNFEALEGVIHEHRPEIHTGMDAVGGRRAGDTGIRGRSGDQGRRGSDGTTVSVDSAHDQSDRPGGHGRAGSERKGHGASIVSGRDVQPGPERGTAGEGGLRADRHIADVRRQLPGTPREQDGGAQRGVSEQDGGRQEDTGVSVKPDAGRVGGDDAHSVSGRELVDTAQTGVSKAAPKPQKANAQRATAHQEPYTPRSEAASMGTLVPRNMASPLKSALKSLEKRRGDIDGYVAKELGYSPSELKKYFAGEQIDAIGLAIDNISQGSGFIIGDQTGIGKGRVNAAIIRYARQKGLTPVFITMKPDLYADMIRDLNDIGETGFNALPTNAGLAGIKAIPLPDGRLLRTKDSKKHTALLQKAAENGVADFDAVFTTYDQLSTSGKEGKDDRREFMRAIAPNALFILDESHNAGGSESGKTRKAKDAAPSRAEFVRELLALSPHGAFYSSATYAKRPDVMSLYFKTDMRHAVDDIGKLAEAVSAGGIPLQQVVAAQLTESGQYIRRERSFEGASVEVAHAEAKLEHAEQSATIMRTILAFDTVKQKAMEAVKQDARGEGEGEDVGDSSATGEKGANSTNFTSIMHNLIGQSLLAMKAKAAADEAALAVERGEKPVLTLANTMGSFIEEHVRGNGVQAGDELNLSFKDLFRRYLQKTRTLTKKDSSGKKVIESRLLTDKELGEEGVTAYNEVLQIIDGSVFDELPISPIDFITAELEQRGISVGEITGRTHAVEYRDGVPHYRARKTSSAQNIETMRKFNNGELDTMILNQSGSTGISLHSSSTFTDQRRRTMIIVHPELNIDVFMQTLGRVFRTGQVVPPSYKLLTSDIPAEKRPAAVLGKKMAGLNANTTASRTTDTTFQNIPDFLNEYGDIVTAQIMDEEPELHAALGKPLSGAESSKGLSREDAVRKVTGRIPMLPLKEQQALYERIEADYKDLIAQLEATGGSALEAKTLPLDARLVESSELTPAREDVATESPFAAESRLGLFDVKVLGKPYTPEQVAAMIEKGKDSAPDVETVRKETLDWLKNKLDSMENEEAKDNLKERVTGQFDTVRDVFTELPVGTPVHFNTTEASFEGIVTRHEYKGKGNPSAPSAWRVTVAVADAAKQITVPYSKIALGGTGEISVGGASIRPHPRSFDDVLEKFSSGQNVKREKRYIAFGNILAAYASVGSQGQVINFEDSDGNVRAGILYKKDASRDGILGMSAVSFPDFEAVSAFFAATQRKGIVKSADGNLVLAANGDQFKFSVPASKAKGAQFFLNGKLLEAAGKDFVKSGNQMGMTVDANTTAAMVGVLREQGFGLVAGSHKEEARKVMGMDDKPLASLRKDMAAGSTVVGKISEYMATRLPSQKAGDILLDAEGIAHIEERHGKDIRNVGFQNAIEFVQHVVKKFDSIYQGTGPRDVALVVHDSKNVKRAILKLEFASDGDFYRVKTAGPVGSGFYKNKSLLWKRAPTSQLSKESPNAISGQSRLSGENDTPTTKDVNEFQASITPGEFLPPRRETRQRLRGAAVRRVAEALATRAKNAVPTRVVDTFNELPAKLRRVFAEQSDLVEGVYYDCQRALKTDPP